MDVQWALVALALISPALAWWGTTKYFTGKVQQWIDDTEQSTKEWRTDVGRRLQVLEEQMTDTEKAVLATKVETMGQEIWSLREWKHLRGDPYVNAMDALNKRVERLERILNGKL